MNPECVVVLLGIFLPIVIERRPHFPVRKISVRHGVGDAAARHGRRNGRQEVDKKGLEGRKAATQAMRRLKKRGQIS